MKSVAILWEDSAHLHFGWGDVDHIESDRPIFCVTFGIVVEETEEYLLVVQSSDTDVRVVSNSLKIPRKAIIAVKELPPIEKLFPKYKKHFNLTLI